MKKRALWKSTHVRKHLRQVPDPHRSGQSTIAVKEAGETAGIHPIVYFNAMTTGAKAGSGSLQAYR